MNEEQLTPQPFPNYNIPQGIPVAPHPKHASVLMKMIKSVGKVGLKTPKKAGRGKTQGVRVGHSRKKPIWY